MRFTSQMSPGCARGRSGFTLVELLVVVSIIALLISILLPSLKSAREQSKTIKCLAHQRGLAQAGMTFTADHNGRFQLAATEGDAAGLTGVRSVDPDRNIYEYGASGELLSWPVAMARSAKISFADNWKWGVRADNWEAAYAKRDKMTREFEAAICPSDQVQISTPFWPHGTDGLRGSGDPNDPVTPTGGTSYWGYLSFGINEDVVGTETKTKSGQAWPAVWKNGNMGESGRPGWQNAGLRLRGILDRSFDPSTILLMVDAGPNSVQEAKGISNPDVNDRRSYVNLITSAQARQPTMESSVYQWPGRIPTKRHPGGAVNVAFADFHAANVKPTTWEMSDVINEKIPAAYNQKVRISPYSPFVQ